MKRSSIVVAFSLAAFGFVSQAQAQSRGWLDNTQAYSAPDQQSYYDARRVAYDNGFREGVKQGEKDGQKNQAFEYQDEKTFRNADKGYHREYGTLERYRQSFRNGYSAGYSDGYQRYAPSYGAYGNPGYGNGRYGQGRAVPRDNRGVYGGTAGGYPQPYPQQYPQPYPQQYPQTYPQQYPQYPGSYGPYGSYGNIASQNGFNDGLEKGRDDARKNRSFDPLRQEWYRSGDRHYDSRYGSREQYKNLYREGFRAGYDRGYRYGG
jgi:flagellar biosynthesis/type III secretory pathway protein FliH